MKVPTGIEVRHQWACASRVEDGAKKCDCSPNYRASVWSARDKRLLKRTFRTLAEAKRWHQDASVDLRRGVVSAPRSPTVSVAGEAWLKGAKAGTILNRSGRVYKPSTLRGYEQGLRIYVEPALGGTRVAELRRADLQHFVDELIEDGLGPSTVRNALMPLRALCRRAVIRGDLSVNPTHGLELPAQTGKRDRVASPTEAAALLLALPVTDRAVWATAFYAGLRLGELQALRRRDIDLDQGVLRVLASWDRKEGRIEPKSSAGLRVAPIAKVLRPLLAPLASDSTSLAFGRTASLAFSPSGVVQRAHRVWTEAGLQVINPHECRHTFASLMIAAGVNVKALQVFMGHASITMTLDLYGHLLPGSETEAAELLDAYLSRA